MRRINPAYAELAYRKAIVGEMIQLLRDKYTPAYGDEPEKTIVCEDVFRDESDVPQSAIEDYIGELTQQEANLELELNRFEFVKREGEDEPSVTPTKAKASKRQSKAKGSRQGKARGRKVQARQHNPGNQA